MVPRDHRFAKRARLRLAEAADEPFIASGEKFAMRAGIHAQSARG
ncbi:MAG TPA: hypothetical protein VNW96_20760 [Mycobacterium sp.]|nr:hypothetical protein [Mycobacterium sp.]